MNSSHARLIVSSLVVLMVGCSGAPPATGKKGDAKSKSATAEGKNAGGSTGTLVVAADSLPALGEPMEGLDEGRLKASGPEGWRLKPRDSAYLVKFALTDKASFPSIIVTGYDSKEPANLTEENAEGYAAARQQELLKETTKASVGQDFRPIKLPNAVGVYYVRKSKIENTMIERVIITLIKDGHRYDVETRSVPANVQEYEKFGQAVANGLEWTKAAPKEEAKGDAP